MELLNISNKWVYPITHKKSKRTEYDNEERDNNVQTCEGTARERGVDETKGEGDSGIKMDHPTKSPDGMKQARTEHTRSTRPLGTAARAERDRK
jgi:hypothetical protein